MAHTNELRRSTPEAQGISSSAIQAFVDANEQKGLGVQSFMLVRNGHIVADGWWKPYAAQLPHIMFSVSKSFTSTAIGLAVSEGRLSVDDPVISFFPSYVTPEISENMGTLKVRHLLSMSTGHDEDTMIALRNNPDKDWVSVFLSRPIKYEPGTHFLYNSGASFMLSAILQSITGQTALEYLRPRLFTPLGIENPLWQTNHSGINLGASGLRLRTGDLAKFGQLYLQRGVWNGQCLIPEEWIEEATSVHVSNGDDPNSDWSQGYGYQIWRCRHNLFRFDGAFGQFCIIMPEQNAIMAITSGTRDMPSVLNAVWEHILPALGSEPLPEDTATTQKLTERLTNLAMPIPPALAVDPELATRIAQRQIQLEPNDLRAREVSFAFDKDATTLTIIDDQNVQHTIRCGKNDWASGESALWIYEEPPVPLPIAAHGGWVDDHTFVMNWQYIDTPFRHIISFDFSKDDIDVSIRLDLPFWEERNAQIHGHFTA
jgi:CubicO group peptidase (beta-lactamase class C family)